MKIDPSRLHKNSELVPARGDPYAKLKQDLDQITPGMWIETDAAELEMSIFTARTKLRRLKERDPKYANYEIQIRTTEAKPIRLVHNLKPKGKR